MHHEEGFRELIAHGINRREIVAQSANHMMTGPLLATASLISLQSLLKKIYENLHIADDFLGYTAVCLVTNVYSCSLSPRSILT